RVFADRAGVERDIASRADHCRRAPAVQLNAVARRHGDVAAARNGKDAVTDGRALPGSAVEDHTTAGVDGHVAVDRGGGDGGAKTRAGERGAAAREDYVTARGEREVRRRRARAADSRAARIAGRAAAGHGDVARGADDLRRADDRSRVVDAARAGGEADRAGVDRLRPGAATRLDERAVAVAGDSAARAAGDRDRRVAADRLIGIEGADACAVAAAAARAAGDRDAARHVDDLVARALGSNEGAVIRSRQAPLKLDV